ncbi:MAG: methylenetetrahydrofolate reductase C-terminal domain-containing protein [Promethearchaeota archaeon]
MIITTPKNWEEIQRAILDRNIKKATIVSCGGCAAHCGTGGTEGLKKLLESVKTLHIEVKASMVIQDPCDNRNIKRDFQHISQEINESDGIIVAACGIGAQTIAAYTKKPTIVTTDTIMMGETVHIGEYSNRCEACGHCVLNETGGICPITMCPKSLLNGPCGGMKDGKCEVDSFQNPCVWVLIADRLKELGQESNLEYIRDPQDWNKRRILNLATVQTRKSYYQCPEGGSK